MSVHIPLPPLLFLISLYLEKSLKVHKIYHNNFCSYKVSYMVNEFKKYLWSAGRKLLKVRLWVQCQLPIYMLLCVGSGMEWQNFDYYCHPSELLYNICVNTQLVNSNLLMECTIVVEQSISTSWEWWGKKVK